MEPTPSENMRKEAIEFRKRVREALKKKIEDQHKQAPRMEGGFLPAILPLLPTIASALPGVIEAGKALFRGSGKHKATSKTRKPNSHAEKVGKIMREHKAAGHPISLAEASQLAKQS